jgi:hypothetical protein
MANGRFWHIATLRGNAEHFGRFRASASSVVAAGVAACELFSLDLPPLTDEYIRQVIAAFKEINPDYLIPGDCAGERFYDLVRAEMPNKVIPPRSEPASSSEHKSQDD